VIDCVCYVTRPPLLYSSTLPRLDVCCNGVHCSANHLESSAALCALTKLLTADMIPAIIGEVVKLLRHDKELVRKKVVACCYMCMCACVSMRICVCSST
jgi:hypothetical protein